MSFRPQGFGALQQVVVPSRSIKKKSDAEKAGFWILFFYVGHFSYMRIFYMIQSISYRLYPCYRILKTSKKNSYESMKKDFYKKQDAITNARITQESNVLDDFQILFRETIFSPLFSSRNSSSTRASKLILFIFQNITLLNVIV